MEGEHTIIGKIPRERLNQIASRKLSALGVPVRLGGDRETLEGELAFAGRVAHPATGQAIPRARFVVVGHDQLRFADPPLAALGPLGFYDHERTVQLEAAVAAALAQRLAALQDVAARMRALRLEATLDPDRLAMRAVVKATTHAFELFGTPDGVRVARVAPVGGRPFEVAPEFPSLDLVALGSSTDLELFLCGHVPAMQAAPRSTPAPSPAGAGGAVVATPPPRNALTLAVLSEVFGQDAMLAPNAMVELVQEFEHGGTRYRFVAARDVGTRFRGRLIGPSGDVWADRFELQDFPGTGKVVALALGGAEPSAGPAAGAASGAAAAPGAGRSHGDLPGHLQPHPGEVWVMNVVVEDSGGDEVRYVGTDIDGKPYGAARVLKRSDFEAVFSEERGGWRLLIQIDQAQDGQVIYRQLDRQRQPMGAPRKMAAAILVANFVPEAAAY
jgi:hypothetical protein